MMKSATVFCLLSLLGIGACCNLENGESVQSNSLFGSWYEIDSYGDTLKAIFSKCIKNEIVQTNSDSSTIQKTRSYRWKLFPFITWHEKSTMNNRGAKWDLTTSSWFGSSTTGMSVIEQSDNYLILKSCPNAWFTDERIWVYAKNKDLTAPQIAAINKALSNKNEPAYSSFRTISQSC